MAENESNPVKADAQASAKATPVHKEMVVVEKNRCKATVLKEKLESWEKKGWKLVSPA